MCLSRTLKDLSDYIDGKVVFTKEARQELASHTKDTLSAITFAMQREADSILYYHEAKQFIAEKYYNIIDNIIIEERKHFVNYQDCEKSMHEGCACNQKNIYSECLGWSIEGDMQQAADRVSEKSMKGHRPL